MLSSPDGAPQGALDLVVVGDCNPDVVVSGGDVTPVFGQKERLVDAMSLMIGGSAAITAVAAVRLGLRVALVAAVADDPAGELMLLLLRREGVDTSSVQIKAGLATGITTVLSHGTDRAILTALGAIPTLRAADVPAELLARARHLHVSSYFLVEESLGPGLAGLLATARRLGLGTSLDTNDDPAGGWGGELLRSALTQVDLFLPNEAEALAIGGEADLAAAISVLCQPRRRPRRGVVVKLGSAGAICARTDLDADSTPTVVPAPPVRPVDTTGAGDCFNAGLIAGLLRGLDLPRATALGCAVGAASTLALGGTGARVDLETALRAVTAAPERNTRGPAVFP